MDNIETLAGNFKSYSELQEYCDAQFVVVKNLTTENQKLKAELEHIKTLLAGSVPLIEKQPELPKIEVSAEQAICEMQIKKLQQTAMQRELTLEETKRLDLLIKNLYLSKGQSTQIVENKINPGAYSDAELMSIASQPEKRVDD